METINTSLGTRRKKIVVTSYNDIPSAIERIRRRNRYTSVSFTELDKDGTPKTDGRVVTECSLEDEEMIKNTPMYMTAKDLLMGNTTWAGDDGDDD
jgi:hypothetical protein